jgi:integrase
MGKLNAAFVKHAKPGRYGDGRGLCLQVKDSGARSWMLRYDYQKRERWMGLGSVEFVSLAQARDQAFELRRKLKQEKIDPLEHRRATVVGARIAALTGATFEQVARRCIEMKTSEWRGDGSRREWLSTLERYAFPVLGSLPVLAIDAVLVHRVLEPIWSTKPHVGQRLRERIEAVLDYAKAMKLRSGENPALWRGNLEHMLPKANRTSREHHPALPYAELPDLMMELRALPGLPARALKFAILTAARTGEVRFARWSEIKFADSFWLVPAERMKSGKEHRVPLSARALAILAELPREAGSDAVFPGRSNGRFINQDAMADVLAKLRPDVTVHGFRSTFRDWAAETTHYPNHVLEMALAHAIPSAVEKSYRRGDLFVKRARLMADWAVYCEAPERGKVVVLRR